MISLGEGTAQVRNRARVTWAMLLLQWFHAKFYFKEIIHAVGTLNPDLNVEFDCRSNLLERGKVEGRIVWKTWDYRSSWQILSPLDFRTITWWTVSFNRPLQLFGLFVNLVFLGQAFTIMLVYVWSRRNPYVRMNFFGLLIFQAPFLPWVLMGFSLLLGNSIIVDLLGKELLNHKDLVLLMFYMKQGVWGEKTWG